MTDQTTPETEHPASHANSEGGGDQVDGFLNFELPDVSQTVEYHDDSPESTDPEAVENAPETEPGDSSGQGDAEKWRGVRDDKNGFYDPAIHKYPPEKTPTGKWKKKSRKELEQQAKEGGDDESNASTRLNAQKFAGLYASLHQGLFEDARPNADYMTDLIDSIEQYFNEQGEVEIPAGANVVLSAAMYSQEVATRETNRERMNRYMSILKGWTMAAFYTLTGIGKKEAKKSAKQLDEERRTAQERKPQ